MKCLENTLEILCERIYPPITFYEKKGKCTIERKNCRYCNVDEKEYFCTKKNKIHLKQPTLKFV